MDAIAQAHEQLEKRSNLSKSIADIEEAIAALQDARNTIVSSPETSILTMAKLKQPMKASFEKLDDDLKEVNKGLNQYQKALDKKFKKSITTVPTALADQSGLINRAILMHLLREGKFDVASTLEAEIRGHGEEDTTRSLLASSQDVKMSEQGSAHSERTWLQNSFTEMYTILDALRNHHDLGPAIVWARQHSNALEKRGSDLEFELSRLKFVELLTRDDSLSNDSSDSQLRALRYAQTVFEHNQQPRYFKEISSLICSLAFYGGLDTSPYRSLYCNQSAWEEASDSFTREFCGLLGLSERSPLYTTVTAGGIALPVLEKFESINAKARGQWTSPNELPVETPMPYSYKFHSIFVCPVSKEQATDDNPPMMLPCGHVIAQQSLEAHARGKNRMKCPYCPVECAPRDAKRIFI